MSKKVLITGGTGTVGKHLSQLLTQKGYKVQHLSRNPEQQSVYKTFKWDIEKKEIDAECIKGVDVIVHLAGAGIADKRWTDERKEVLINSRTDSITLIYDLLKKYPHQVETVVSASAAGFYSDRGNQLMVEKDLPANDFLADCCIKWEDAVDKAKGLGLRVVKFRTGVILDKESGALQKIAQPIKFGVGAPLGSGNQWISWIHLQDVIDMYVYGIENENLHGAYNMCSPYPLTNKALTKAIAKQLKKPLWLPNVPTFALNLALGEMSAVVLGSTKMSTQKIEDAGFRFKFADIKNALNYIYA
ncbi:TIGR01777 family oxidoreductase [Pedobacter alpinus]|uniref:TIGR01777 family oxidoreductase n=1 Tax=Pedobacter alpinus TaxID=1590643 RepID=A0ABW5TWS5_9SPHI